MRPNPHSRLCEKAGWCAALEAAILLTLSLPMLAGHDPFTIRIRTSHDSFKSGAEVAVAINLTNTSDKEIFFTGTCAPKADVNGFKVEVDDSHGNIAPETNLLRSLRGEPVPKPKELASGTSGPGCGVVPPGHFVNSGFVLNRFYDLTQSGQYKLQVERLDSASKVVVKSNTITLTITP